MIAPSRPGRLHPDRPPAQGPDRHGRLPRHRPGELREGPGQPRRPPRRASPTGRSSSPTTSTTSSGRSPSIPRPRPAASRMTGRIEPRRSADRMKPMSRSIGPSRFDRASRLGWRSTAVTRELVSMEGSRHRVAGQGHGRHPRRDRAGWAAADPADRGRSRRSRWPPRSTGRAIPGSGEDAGIWRPGSGRSGVPLARRCRPGRRSTS